MVFSTIYFLIFYRIKLIFIFAGNKGYGQNIFLDPDTPAQQADITSYLEMVL